MVKLLIEYGADIKTKDNCGRNVYHYLISSNNQNQIEILNILIAKDIESIYELNPQSKESFLHETIKRARTKIFKVLVKKNLDLTRKDIDGARYNQFFHFNKIKASITIKSIFKYIA